MGRLETSSLSLGPFSRQARSLAAATTCVPFLRPSPSGNLFGAASREASARPFPGDAARPAGICLPLPGGQGRRCGETDPPRPSSALIEGQGRAELSLRQLNDRLAALRLLRPPSQAPSKRPLVRSLRGQPNGPPPVRAQLGPYGTRPAEFRQTPLHGASGRLAATTTATTTKNGHSLRPRRTSP